ncbi:MAG: sigma factor, partial [Mariprofundaceae bacterium]|nr:sigma factor [Mariprofundaceae bacterium]
MDAFLADVELRALRMAEIATRSRDDALDIVQDAMFALVRRYRGKPADAWPALFYRILQNGIRDWHRRKKLRATCQQWFMDGDRQQEALEAAADSPSSDPVYRLGISDAGKCLIHALKNLPLRQQQVF